MTRDEVVLFLGKIKSQWNNFPDISKDLITSWEENLKNRSYDDCLLALKMYQNPKDGEGIRNSRFYPHVGDINGICRSIDDIRVGVRSEVMNLAKRAVNNFPSNGEEERKEAIELFGRMCMKQKKPIKCAKRLKNELDNFRILATSTGMIEYLKPVTQIIREAPVYDE